MSIGFDWIRRGRAVGRQGTGSSSLRSEPIFIRNRHQLRAARDAPSRRASSRRCRRARRGLKSAAEQAAAVETSNDTFNEVLCRSVADLYMLMTDTPQGPYPYAGIPWYSTTFGRDGLITAMQMLWLDPTSRAASCGASRPSGDKWMTILRSQPGKILHEMRGGEMAALGEVPFGLYYGSVDSTPLFVMLAGLYCGTNRR